MRLLKLIIFCCVSTVSTAQSYRVELDSNLKYDGLLGRSIADLYAIGSAQARQSELYQEITFPENFEANDTALALTYFRGKQGQTDPLRFVLIGNYKAEDFFLYCDKNGNLDFTDDGPAKEADVLFTTTIYFSRDGESGAHYGVVFKKGFNDSSAVAQFEKLITRSPYIDHEIPRVSATHWFFTHLLNTRSAITQLGGDKVMIALQDADADGLITANGHDAFAIVEENVELDFRRSRSGITLQDTTLFRWKGQNYLITEVDSFGNFLEFKETSLPYNSSLRPGSQVPAIKLETLDNEPVELTDLLNKSGYTLLYLWGDWCKGCHMGAEELRQAAEEYQKQLKVIGINSGEPRAKIEGFVKKYQHNWPQYYNSSAFRSTFFTDKYPAYILLDSEGKLVSYDAYPRLWNKLLK